MGWIDVWMNGIERLKNGWMDECTDGMGEWMDE